MNPEGEAGTSQSDATRSRLRARIRGAVQGVGFRPFVFRLASELELTGWVRNSPAGVELEVEGGRVAIERFLLRLEREKPPLASIQSLEPTWLEASSTERTRRPFDILESSASGHARALVLPDIAICAECTAEIRDPAARRYRYPFTNCTNCGPRYSIIESLPYDRPRTTMRGFALCGDCREEYENPRDRRFHAQPIACPRCGPKLTARDASGQTLATESDALRLAVDELHRGLIVALKGIGGFQLLVDATNETAIRRLRERKHREEKPFAVMTPGLEAAREIATLAPLEERLLASPEAPIVIVAKRDGSRIGPSVAPRNPNLGIMLPCSPLHVLLLDAFQRPVIATSGNRSEEPIAIEDGEALRRLQGIADLWLGHDRPIARAVDDSVARVILGREQVLRRARGFAPLPIRVRAMAEPVLALGAQLKNAIGLGLGDEAYLSQHVGDLENRETEHAFLATIDALTSLYPAEPRAVLVDLHPDYLSSRHGEQLGLPLHYVQHHHAHVAAVMAENEIDGPCLGVAWDGTGLGLDRTIWGGEFFRVAGSRFERFAAWPPFRLPGGDHAAREPRRSALGLLHAWKGAAALDLDLPVVRSFREEDRGVLARMLERGINSPLCSSTGRLFDAISALLGIRQESSFEGQAAMELEYVATEANDVVAGQALPFRLQAGRAARAHAPRYELDWEPMLSEICTELQAMESVEAGQRRPRVAMLARRFHHMLAEAIVTVARAAGETCIALGGGCFQNRLLTELTHAKLTAAGFRVAWPQRVPPNDGAIALGQLFLAARSTHVKEEPCASRSPVES